MVGRDCQSLYLDNTEILSSTSVLFSLRPSCFILLVTLPGDEGRDKERKSDILDLGAICTSLVRTGSPSLRAFSCLKWKA